MEKLVLLLFISVACLCDAASTHRDRNGFLSADSGEKSDDYVDNNISCGLAIATEDSQFKITKRITSGGVDTKYLEFPWIVALFAPRNTNQQCALTDNSCWFFRCGGSLISSRVVLTAAICVYEYQHTKTKVRAGDWNLDTLEEPYPHQERYVSKTIIHELYHDSNVGSELTYDASLLVLESHFIMTDNIGFICLPPPNLNVASANCKAAGWGVQNFGDSGYQKLLQVVDMNYVDHYTCQNALRTNWWASFVLHDSFTCAGGVKDKDTCQGDGGSPLMCFAEDHYYVRGLTSWGVGCGNANLPGVYTDVVKVRSWIDQKMIANGFNTDTYTFVVKQI